MLVAVPSSAVCPCRQPLPLPSTSLQVGAEADGPQPQRQGAGQGATAALPPAGGAFQRAGRLAGRLPTRTPPSAPALLPSNSRAAVLPPTPLAGAQEGAGPPAGAPHQPGRRVRGCELVCASWLSRVLWTSYCNSSHTLRSMERQPLWAKELRHGCLGWEGCLLSRPAALQWAGTCRDRCRLCCLSREAVKP